MKLRILLLSLMVALPVCLQVSGVVDFFDLDYLKQNEVALKEFKRQHPLIVLSVFVAVYTIVCSLPIPAVAMLTVTAGMLFGFINGLIVVSFSSAVGATLAFWLARYLGQEFLHKVLGNEIAGVDRELNDAGFAYATSLRLIPGVPFFVVNTALGLTTIRTATFYLSTQIGMLLMLGILVNAGDKLSRVSSLDDVLSANVIVSLALLALVPLSIRMISRRSRG
jgi:uncharacterized membrane protein YdjX (TVP38/TMEM64 family)